MIALWENESHCLTVVEYFKGSSLADHMCCLEHMQGGPKARTTAETVVKSGVAPPCGNSGVEPRRKTPSI